MPFLFRYQFVTKIRIFIQIRYRLPQSRIGCVNFAIGLRNSNDKLMRLGIVAGYKVTVCDNLSFAGEYQPMFAKHSKISIWSNRVQLPLTVCKEAGNRIREMIDFKRGHRLSDGKARDMLYQLFTDAKFPISLFRTTHKDFFIEPSYNEFKSKTLWSLENAVTTSIKKLQPISQYENTVKLGKFIESILHQKVFRIY